MIWEVPWNKLPVLPHFTIVSVRFFFNILFISVCRTDIQSDCRNIYDILSQGVKRDQRMTANKVIDVMQGKTVSGIKIKKGKIQIVYSVMYCCYSQDCYAFWQPSRLIP